VSNDEVQGAVVVEVGDEEAAAVEVIRRWVLRRREPPTLTDLLIGPGQGAARRKTGSAPR
jgi:hypothetical protein